ncbi:MAG: acyl-CoA thioesterase [Acidobacteria bacterium]|nr:acyl-CoA thioesterase [Acidobacteriota bacterium]
MSLSGYKLVTTVSILWGDEDAFAHVNNLSYLRWCETSRVEYLMRIALWNVPPPNGAGPILASIRCDYKIPLTYPDTVDVGTRVTAIGNSSIRMEHVVVSRKLSAVAATVDSTLVMYDYDAARPIRVPDAIREAIGALEGRSFDSESAARR